MAAIKVTLGQKDAKKHVVKYSTSKDGVAVSSIYLDNKAVEKLGDPDEVILTITAAD